MMRVDSGVSRRDELIIKDHMTISISRHASSRVSHAPPHQCLSSFPFPYARNDHCNQFAVAARLIQGLPVFSSRRHKDILTTGADWRVASRAHLWCTMFDLS